MLVMRRCTWCVWSGKAAIAEKCATSINPQMAFSAAARAAFLEYELFVSSLIHVD